MTRVSAGIRAAELCDAHLRKEEIENFDKNAFNHTEELNIVGILSENFNIILEETLN